MKIFFSESMVADIGMHTSPSSMKPREVATALKRTDLNIDFVEPEPVTVETLGLAHDPKFITDILQGKISNGFGNRSQEVIRSLPFTSGSMLCAAKTALVDGIAASLSSGFHHAGYAHAAGFCTFNGLMVAACALHHLGLVQRVAIIDCDQHYGDGTSNIIRELGITFVAHFSFGEWYNHPSHAAAYLTRLRGLKQEFNRNRPDIILYQAGADVHVDDPLGGVLTTEEMSERDAIVFGMSRQLEIPIAWNLAGGYQRDEDDGISKVVALHVTTARIACEIYGDEKL